MKTRATMAAGGDETRKMMGDPYALGGFVPDRDRHGIKYCNIEFGTGKVTTKAEGLKTLSGVWRQAMDFAMKRRQGASKAGAKRWRIEVFEMF